MTEQQNQYVYMINWYYPLYSITIEISLGLKPSD